MEIGLSAVDEKKMKASCGSGTQTTLKTLKDKLSASPLHAPVKGKDINSLLAQ